MILLMIVSSLFFPDFLLVKIIEKPYLPMGTLVAWLSLLSFALLPWLMSSSIRLGETMYFLVLKYITYLATGLAFTWPFVGRVLATNWSNSFNGAIQTFLGSDEAGYVFWRFTGLIVMLPLLVFILIWGQYLVRKL